LRWRFINHDQRGFLLDEEGKEMSTLLELLGTRYPIIQGPIGAMNSPRLIAAVCEAGGFGMLALGYIADPKEVRDLTDQVRKITDRPFGANLMGTNPMNDKLLEALADSGVKTVTTSAGSPARLYPKIHDLGMKGLHVALSLSFALKAADAGVDGVVVSGLESGGLRSLSPESTNMILIPLVSDHIRIPVVAAGGIADARGYRAALALGAQGVQIGTRFIASEESPASDVWKQAILQCSDGGTILLPQVIMNMRCIINAKLQQLMARPDVDLSKEYNLANAPKAWTSGDFDLFPAGAGQSAALIREMKPVRDIIASMVA
jgi:enoyl-[acyl-carrier protein] reductase II